MKAIKLSSFDLAIGVFLALWLTFFTAMMFPGTKQITYSGKTGGADVYAPPSLYSYDIQATK